MRESAVRGTECVRRARSGLWGKGRSNAPFYPVKHGEAAHGLYSTPDRPRVPPESGGWHLAEGVGIAVATALAAGRAVALVDAEQEAARVLREEQGRLGCLIGTEAAARFGERFLEAGVLPSFPARCPRAIRMDGVRGREEVRDASAVDRQVGRQAVPFEDFPEAGIPVIDRMLDAHLHGRRLSLS